MSKFSKKAIQRQILKTSIESPITLFSIGTAILSGVSMILFDGGMMLRAGLSTGIAVGVSSWLINYYFRKEQLTNEYFKKLEDEFKKRNDQMLVSIKEGLNKSNLGHDVKSYAEQGEDQYSRIQEKFETFNNILGKQFNTGELTYRRFLGTAEQVYLSVLDNLETIATMLMSSNSIDIDYINDRLNHYEHKENKNEDDYKEIESLKERMNIKNEQIHKINKLLSINEQAMTTLDATCTSIASVKTRRGKASQDVEQTMVQLEALAESAKKYEIK